MRRDETLLLDMLIAARKIVRFTDGLTQASLATNEMAASAIMREFQVVGQAARMISDEGKASYSQIPWKVISGMRNHLVHEYFNIDFDILWQTIQDDIPTLIGQLETLVTPNQDEGRPH
ncbi:MAG: DUF86 domain-containing protein [Anaerolineaceae bacterium]|nr:DUF86 domain-containing protein [Anaerolineaceae bacterium]